MPYTPGERLPGEAASKLGHLNVVKSAWVKSLVQEFEVAPPAAQDPSATLWHQFDPQGVIPLRSVWATDGSYVTVSSEDRPPREVSFVKTALLTVDRARLDTIDKELPHPLLLQDVLTNSAVFHATVFPLKNVRTRLGTNYDAIRNIVRDSMQIEEHGAFYETLKWLAYYKWRTSKGASPSFGCPHCAFDNPGLPFDADEGTCPHCTQKVFLTDMIGFHLDTDKQILSDTLFIKDGPLSLRSQYSKLVPAIRSFLQFAKDENRPVHVIGQEKTGAFADHLRSVVRFTPPHARGEKLAYAVLTHDFVRKEVYRSPDLANPYGMRTNWGEKVYVKIDPGTYMALNSPTGLYNSSGDSPEPEDIIGLDRILATIPSLVSQKFEGALFPVELANGIASMSSYPSSAILRRFMEGTAPHR